MMSFFKKYEDILFLLVIIVLSYFTVRSLLLPGFFPIHDNTQVARVFEMQKSLSDGMFPVRWVEDLGYGYGYPIFNFYAPLAYYAGGILNISGVDALTATKLMMALGIILSGIFMYLLAKEFWGKMGGVVAALFYLYAPYHAVDIYVRGDVAEFWAYAFIPLAFLGVYKSFLLSDEKNKKRMLSWIGVTALGYAGVILSHNLSAMMITPFLLLFAAGLFTYLYFTKKHARPYSLFVGLFIGLLLSAFYWLPALSEVSYTNVTSVIGGGSQYKDYFVCLSQLWNSPWGFGGSAPGCIDGISFKIGKLHILFGLLAIIPLLYFWKKDTIRRLVILFSIISLLFAVFLTLEQSKFIWDMLPPMAFFQFPWRFLIVITFFISFLSGAFFYFFHFIFSKKKLYKIGFFIISVFVIIAIIVFNKGVFQPQIVLNKTASDYTSSYALKWVTSKISDEYMPKGFIRSQSAKQIPQSKFTQSDKPFKIISTTTSAKGIHAEISVKQSTIILINQAYFPGWQVFIDNKLTQYTIQNNGLMILVPAGQHIVDVKYSQTVIEKIGDLLSVTGIFILLLGIIYTNTNFYERKKI